MKLTGTLLLVALLVAGCTRQQGTSTMRRPGRSQSPHLTAPVQPQPERGSLMWWESLTPAKRQYELWTQRREMNVWLQHLTTTLQDQEVRVKVTIEGEEAEFVRAFLNHSGLSDKPSLPTTEPRPKVQTVNINTAIFDNLLLIPGMNPDMASWIVFARLSGGAFESTKDRRLTDKFGAQVVDEMKSHIRVRD